MTHGEDQQRLVVFAAGPSDDVPHKIRCRLRQLFGEWHLDSDVAADAMLVVQEMVINVVDHARTRFRLLVRLDDGVLHIAVHDDLPGHVEAAPFDPDRLRGYGLRIVEGMSDRWGCRADEEGKTVWAELDTRTGADVDHSIPLAR